MASGTGISSNSGQGAEEYPRAIILEVEEFFSDTSSESESEDEVPLIPEAEQQRHSVPDDGTRVRRRFPKVKRHAEFQTLRTRRRFPKAKRDAESQTWRAMRRFPNGEVDAQFHSLRAMLRPSIKRVPKDRFSIMMTAYHYAMDLRLSIDNIKYQLDSVMGTNSTPGVPLVRPSPQREPFGIQMPRMRAIDAISPVNPVVEVLRDPLRGNGQVKLKIACANRTDLIHDFRAALEETCLSLVEGTFGCVNGTDFHANVWLEKFTPETPNDVDWNPRPPPLSETVEDGALKELMLFVIRQDTPIYVHH